MRKTHAFSETDGQNEGYFLITLLCIEFLFGIFLFEIENPCVKKLKHNVVAWLYYLNYGPSFGPFDNEFFFAGDVDDGALRHVEGGEVRVLAHHVLGGRTWR